MTKIYQAVFATVLTLAMAANFCLSSPWFSPKEKARERAMLSFAGIGAAHSYFSSPVDHHLEFEIQVRSADGTLLEQFVPAAQYPPVYADYIFAQAFRHDDDEIAAEICERFGSLLGRGPEAQVLIYVREMSLRSFNKMEFSKGSPLVSRIEVIKSC